MNQKIKILHLEDVQSDAELIARELSRASMDVEILLVKDKQRFSMALQNFVPDVILCDHSLNSFDSREALTMIKKAGINAPFILVTATMSDEFAAAVMKDGACDYILKDRLNRLPSAILNSIEKHRLDEEKKDNHELLAFHIENTPLGFIEWDQHGFAKSWSKRAEEIFGWTREEYISDGRSIFTDIIKKDKEKVSSGLQKLFKGELERNEMQYRNETKIKGVIWCKWFNSARKDERGNVTSVMSLVQDITADKLSEQRKDNFLSMASHELNTPLTTIKAYAHVAMVLLEESGDVKTLEIVNRMGEQVNKLADLAKSLLDITKLQNGKLKYDEAYFDFNGLVNEVVDDMQNISITHKIEVDLGKTSLAFGDRSKIAQIIINLISNAVKYSPNAKSIVVRTELEQNGILLSVEDFGIGILHKDQHKVFEQFYRVDGNQSTFPGMGIGLFICSEIIKHKGGKIWVKSQIKEGSTFYFWLPLDYRTLPVSPTLALTTTPQETDVV